MLNPTLRSEDINVKSMWFLKFSTYTRKLRILERDPINNYLANVGIKGVSKAIKNAKHFLLFLLTNEIKLNS